LLEVIVLFQVMRVMLVSVAVKGRGRKMTTQTERRIRRNAAYFLKWPPTSWGRGYFSIWRWVLLFTERFACHPGVTVERAWYCSQYASMC